MGRVGGCGRIGLSLLFLVVGNTGIGASLFEDTISKAPAGNHTILWPLIAVVTFITTLLIVLIIAVNRPGTSNHSIVWCADSFCNRLRPLNLSLVGKR